MPLRSGAAYHRDEQNERYRDIEEARLHHPAIFSRVPSLSTTEVAVADRQIGKKSSLHAGA
jgi:hypothetical protein